VTDRPIYSEISGRLVIDGVRVSSVSAAKRHHRTESRIHSLRHKHEAYIMPTVRVSGSSMGKCIGTLAFTSSCNPPFSNNTRVKYQLANTSIISPLSP